MQFKRPLNVAKTRKTGIPTWVNSFQFLRANKLVLSVKLGELVNELVVMFGPYQRERWRRAGPATPGSRS